MLNKCVVFNRPHVAPIPGAGAARCAIVHPTPAQHRARRSMMQLSASQSQAGGGAPAPATTTAPPDASGPLATKRCEPCEAAKDAEAAMGLNSAMDVPTAQRYMAHLQEGWRLFEDDQGHLRIQRRYRTKNFIKVSSQAGPGKLLTVVRAGSVCSR